MQQNLGAMIEVQAASGDRSQGKHATRPRKRASAQTTVTDILDFERSKWIRRDFENESDSCRDAFPGGSCFIAHGTLTVCATNRTIAELVVARYRSAQSLNREAEAIAATGLRLTRSQLAKWSTRAANLLAPVADAIRTVGLECPVIAVANRSVGIDEGMRLWIYFASGHGDGPTGQRPIAWFRVTPDRYGGYASQELGDFDGFLMAPFAGGYDAVVRNGRVVAAACWGHIRLMARAVDPFGSRPAFAEIVRAADRLSAIEAELTGTNIAERVRLRRERATPVLQELQDALRQAERSAEPESDVARFARELQAQWSSLTAFLHDGRLELENKTTRVMLDRLASRHHWVSRRLNGSQLCMANIATIIETCSLNGVDPKDYLAWILESPPAADARGYTERLMPWHFVLASSANRPLPT